VPLPYQPENNDIPVKTPPNVALDALRTIAVSRIHPASRANPNLESFRGFPRALKPLKRLASAPSAHTQLKLDANERRAAFTPLHRPNRNAHPSYLTRHSFAR